ALLPALKAAGGQAPHLPGLPKSLLIPRRPHDLFIGRPFFPAASLGLRIPAPCFILMNEPFRWSGRFAGLQNPLTVRLASADIGASSQDEYASTMPLGLKGRVAVAHVQGLRAQRPTRRLH